MDVRIYLKILINKQIRFININNKTESNSKIMAEIFHNFFVTIASDIVSKIIHTNYIQRLSPTICTTNWISV